jgi:hypothetical protein
MYGPLKGISTGKNGRYWTVELQESWKIHPTFNISLYKQYRGSDPKKQVVEIESGGAGCKMESIIPSGPSEDHPRQHVHLVKWEGYSHDENMWETYENVLKCSLELLKDYYGKNPLIKRYGRYGKRKRWKVIIKKDFVFLF